MTYLTIKYVNEIIIMSNEEIVKGTIIKSSVIETYRL